VRVEARGADAGGARQTLIAGAAAPTAELAAIVTAAIAVRVVRAGLEPGVHTPGDDAVAALDVLHHASAMGMRVQEFTGLARATAW